MRPRRQRKLRPVSPLPALVLVQVFYVDEVKQLVDVPHTAYLLVRAPRSSVTTGHGSPLGRLYSTSHDLARAIQRRGQHQATHAYHPAGLGHCRSASLQTSRYRAGALSLRWRDATATRLSFHNVAVNLQR
jgi:hypothetical protein